MQNNQGPQLIIPVPPRVGFIYDPAKAPPEDTDILSTTKAQGEHLPIIDYIVGAGVKYVFDPIRMGYKVVGPVDFAPKQGWYIYHIGRQYPQPGFPFPHALKACEGPKRNLINWAYTLMTKEMVLPLLAFAILPKKVKAKILDNFLMRYLELADAHLAPYYPNVEYFLPISLEIKGFIQTFLTSLGVTINTANRFAFAFATLIENDSAYRLRIMDLLTETTKEQMLAHPVAEAQRLIRILAERDERVHLVDKFNKFALLLKFGFFFIRKPFQFALEGTDFQNFQYDDINRHFVKHWTTYNFFGKTIEERVAMYPVENYKKYQVQ